MNVFYYKNGYYLPCLLEAHDGPDKWKGQRSRQFSSRHETLGIPLEQINQVQCTRNVETLGAAPTAAPLGARADTGL